MTDKLRPYPHFRARQIMPPGDFEMALWQVEDGVLKAYRDPIVGWVLGDDWSCYQSECLGKSCPDVDNHELPTREVRPMYVADDVVWMDDPGPNAFIIPKSLSEDDLHKWAQRLQQDAEEMRRWRKEREAQEAARQAAGNGHR